MHCTWFLRTERTQVTEILPHITGVNISVHLTWSHDDVIKWKHFPRNWPFVLGIHRPPVNSPHRGQWRGALMFSLICVWINDCVNNREAGDLRRYRAHYDVIVMSVYIADDDSTTPEQDINRWQSNDHLIFHGMINLSDILTTLYTQDAKQTLTSEAFYCADHKDMVQELAPWSTPRHKSLYEPVLNYCLGNPWEQYSLTFEFKKCLIRMTS